MRNLLALLLLGASLASCSSTSTVSTQANNTVSGIGNINNISRSDIRVMGNIEEKENFSRFWLLFIPFGSGGKSEEGRREKAYIEACKTHKVDGILQPKYETHKVVIPLIVVSFVNYKTTVFGRSYNIKRDN